MICFFERIIKITQMIYEYGYFYDIDDLMHI